MSKVDYRRAIKLIKDSGIDLTPPQWQDKHKYVVPNVDEVKSKAITYYAGLNDDDKETFSHFLKGDLVVFLRDAISPLHTQYDAYNHFTTNVLRVNFGTLNQRTQYLVQQAMKGFLIT